MSDWTAGYVADIGYTYGYYSELNPLRLRHALLNAGVVAPDVRTACELGFGQGISINLNAAASTTQWYGTDFNPSQAAFAQDLASVSGSGAQLFDEGFADFCRRKDLPDFDFIGLHGIWSWVSNENRKVIVDFARRKLKVGGVLYISYNTQPGWAPMVPMRHLLTEHAEVMAPPGRGIVSRINSAIDFAEKLLATSPQYVKANPQVAERIGQMKGHNRNYLAHEYFNRDWHPMPFAEMAEWLLPAKLNYACTAHYISHIDSLNLTPEQLAFVSEIPDPMFRESVRDFMVNQQFRKDYWVKGARKLTALERSEAIRQLNVILIAPRTQLTLTTNSPQGEVKMTERVYGPILDVLEDHKVKSVSEIEQAVKDKGISLTQVLEGMMLLAHTGALTIAQDNHVIERVKIQTDKLNTFLMNKARSSREVGYLASPVTGGGVTVDRFQMLFLLAQVHGIKEPGKWAHFVWQYLSAQEETILKAGKRLETAEENLAELTSQAKEFAEKRMPIMKALQIA